MYLIIIFIILYNFCKNEKFVLFVLIRESINLLLLLNGFKSNSIRIKNISFQLTFWFYFIYPVSTRIPN
jgi:hypothetical protein